MVITMEQTSVKLNKGPQQELSRFHFCGCFDVLEPLDFKVLLLLYCPELRHSNLLRGTNKRKRETH